QLPALFITNKPQLGVITHGGGGTDQAEFATWAQRLLGLADQLPADTTMLVGSIHRQVRQITGVVKVGHRAGDADQLVSIPCGNSEVCMLEYAFNAFFVIHRALLGQCLSRQHINELFRDDWLVDPVLHSSSPAQRRAYARPLQRLVMQSRLSDWLRTGSVRNCCPVPGTPAVRLHR